MRELIRRLRVIYAQKQLIHGVGGQQLGQERYRIVAPGYILEDLMNAADALERMQKDAARLRYAMEDIDGFVHVGKDKYDYAMEIAAKNGRDAPSEDDEMDGIRALIDAAIDHEQPARIGTGDA